ncbi:unnamed protein product [Ceutorhynchus assimilis]|uniref:V(D)J recombination-activating protein 1 RNase H domain-containing protein n=1 Tax=Ceutorhynchus assimilis TaxID=467358 RepID=A0A9N9MBI5_9CUCU|nr:unnamed protein product [Ceutorhynchus assimilis]
MDFQEPGPSGMKMFSRRQLFDLMRQQNLPSITKGLEFLENYLIGYDNYSDDQIKEENFEIPRAIHKTGRPHKTFDGLSERSKRRKTEEMRASVDSQMLTFATQVKLRCEGKRDVSKIVKEVTGSQTEAEKYKKAYSCYEKEKSRITVLQALSMFVEANLSQKQYEIIRSTAKGVFPCYSLLQKAKKDCYPAKESFIVTETLAETNLQSLLNHTVERLLIYLEEVLQSLGQEERKSLLLICKWGCDGSQQAQFKQKFESETGSDTNIFQSSFVPLQLICEVNKKIIWQNPTPSSPRYCRPIRIRFVKESVNTTKEEISYVEEATNLLEPTRVTLFHADFSVRHKMMLTMIDGKICNAATDTTSTMKCYICGLTSKDFNNLQINREVNTEVLKFGLSILHARIRIFESLLHVSYKLTIKKWRLQSEAEKETIKQRKIQIQHNFRNQMGLIVDIPKPGFGSTNDGNTSRRFFADPEAAAEITGIDFNLIYRFKVILETISSGHRINEEKFHEYCMDTAKIYVDLYPWHPMTPTMHKILMHSATVIKNALLPIGQLSEEAAEARNKHFRQYRQNFARKFSRVSCNLDVINRLLLSSDPLLSKEPKLATAQGPEPATSEPLTSSGAPFVAPRAAAEPAKEEKPVEKSPEGISAEPMKVIVGLLLIATASLVFPLGDSEVPKPQEPLMKVIIGLLLIATASLVFPLGDSEVPKPQEPLKAKSDGKAQEQALPASEEPKLATAQGPEPATSEPLTSSGAPFVAPRAAAEPAKEEKPVEKSPEGISAEPVALPQPAAVPEAA